jgi:hypothetical protein
MSPDKYKTLELWGAWFSGIATFAAVFVALFSQWYAERRRRPKLKVEFDGCRGEHKRYVPPTLAHGTNALKREELWVRLCVQNLTNNTATDVQVRFIRAERESDQRHENLPSWWFKVSNLNAHSVSIPGQFPQYFDIAYIKNELTSDHDVSLYPVLIHGDFESWLEEKRRIETDAEIVFQVGFVHDLFFAVVSSNAAAKFYRMRLKVLPHRIEDPPFGDLMGSARLRERVDVLYLEEITPKEAAAIN